MGILFNIVLPVMIGLFALLFAVFLVRGITARAKATSAAYEVGRQEARHRAQVNILRSLASLAIAALLLVIVFVVPRVVNSSPEATPTVEAPLVEPTLAPSATDPSTLEPATGTPPPSPTTAIVTPSPTSPPTETPTPEPQTAVVTSGVGVWLRAEPGTETEQLEWLFEGTELVILPGRQTVEEIEWQQVQTVLGSAGWVAAEFIATNP